MAQIGQPNHIITNLSDFMGINVVAQSLLKSINALESDSTTVQKISIRITNASLKTVDKKIPRNVFIALYLVVFRRERAL